MGLVSAYLVLYNLVQAIGWSFVLHSVVTNLGCCDTKGAERNVDLVPEWVPFGRNLVCVTGDMTPSFNLILIFQTAAILEIVHAALGFVGSKVAQVLPQVFSRVILTWGICFVYPEAVVNSRSYAHMLIAWGITEVIRYNWYWTKDVFGKAPFILTWCRYTFFTLLYPLGVFGEISCILILASQHAALVTSSTSPYFAHVSAFYSFLISALILAYVPLFPPLYFHMFSQRKKALSPARPREPVKEDGLQFPKNEQGARSTSQVNQTSFAMSVINVDANAAAAVLREKNWRFGYPKHVVKQVALSCQSEANCLQIARDGLAYMHKNFEFIRNGKTTSLEEAMASIKTSFAGQLTVKGSGPRPAAFSYTVPYRAKPYPSSDEPKNLEKDDLIAQLKKWAENGSIEPSCRDAIAEVVNHPEWLDDLKNKYFVLLGAGSAMGPFEVLMKLGANIIAVDLDRPGIWKRLLKIARESCGTITFPIKKPASEVNAENDDEIAAVAGCNLFTETPEICNWLKTVVPGKPLIIGGYAYLDGEMHVRVSLAMDAIKAGVIAARPKGSVSLGYLCSPTDVFVCDTEARNAMVANYKKGAGFVAKLMHAISPKKYNVKNAIDTVKVGDREFCIVDGIVVQQGPNYALAKRLQHWRAMLARAEGSPVSTNIAPSTATASVVHNKSFAFAYGGMRYFKPMEVSYQETSNAVMGALLIHDMSSPKSKALPANKLQNPVDLFKGGAFHGGVWRSGYKIGSIGETATLLFALAKYGGHLTLAVVAVAAAVWQLCCGCNKK